MPFVELVKLLRAMAPEQLLFFYLLVGAAILLACRWVTQRSDRSALLPPYALVDPYTIAYLCRGESRVAQLGITDLFWRKFLQTGTRRRWWGAVETIVSLDTEEDVSELPPVLAATALWFKERPRNNVAAFPIRRLKQLCKPYRLILNAQQLLAPPVQLLELLVYAVSWGTALLLLAAGVVLWPYPWWALGFPFWMGAGMGAVAYFFLALYINTNRGRLSQRGKRCVKELASAYSYVARPYIAHEMFLMCVSVNGPSGLRGTPYSFLIDMLEPPSTELNCL